MDIFTSLNPRNDYSSGALQAILGAWVLATPLEKRSKVAISSGFVPEEAYDKASVYSLLYSLYRSIGEAESETGERYEFTFNTWGYEWPSAWGNRPVPETDPQRFGKYAYNGLVHFKAIQDYARKREGRVHVVEMGCGTGAGAHEICKNALPHCTYEAVDMQESGIRTARRRFVPELGGRLVATRANCTDLLVRDKSVDIAIVCETHVTEVGGKVTEEDKRFFATAERILRPGGYLSWGNAIPDDTWQPCIDHLASIGLALVESVDVTPEAILARDKDKARIDSYVEQALRKFLAFRIPVLGRRKALEAAQALKNFARNPGTDLYDTMVKGDDTYKVSLFRKSG